LIRIRISRQPLRVLGFDLENRPGAYWYGDATTALITAIGWKWTDEKTPHSLVLRSDDYWESDDGTFVPGDIAFIKFRDEMCKAGLVFGHNIRRHDLPLLNTAYLRRKLPHLVPVNTTDTLRDLPKRKGMAASLDNLAAELKLPGKKFHMTQHDWEESNELREEGVRMTRKRVESDVVLQEKLRAELLKLGWLGSPRMWRP
jgi:hypothetical protein